MVESPGREAAGAQDRREGLHPDLRPTRLKGSPRDVAMVCQASCSAMRRSITSASATAPAGEPVTAARNCERSRDLSDAKPDAVTVAVRGTLRSNAISPKKSPGPSLAS